MPFKQTDLTVKTSDGRNCVLLEPLVYFSPQFGQTFRAPVGAKTDGASTPPALWTTLPPFGVYWLAAVIHDAAYQDTLQVFTGTDWTRARLTKDQADNLLKEAMDSLGVSERESIVIYEGVHFGGADAFRDDRLAAPL